MIINPYSFGGVVSYYVAESGSGDGSSAGNAASLSTFQSDLPSLPIGTNIYFNKGDTFAVNDLTIPQNNISIRAYGSGADPIFLGSESLSAATWTNEGSGFYSTTLASAPKWIFINGEAARHGESDWIPINSTPSSTSRGANASVLNAFNSVQSLVGAKLRVKEYAWRIGFEQNITAYSTGVITTAETFVGGDIGYPFKLYGQKQFCTIQNDWFFDGTKLWIYKSTSPSGTDIRVTYSDRAFSVASKSGVSFTGVEFKHYYQEAIYSTSANNLLIDDCNIHDIRGNGILGLGASDGVTIQNSTITRCGLNGISCGIWQNYVIQNNTISYIGAQANLGWPINTSLLKTGGVGINTEWESMLAPYGGYVYRNTISHTGYNAYTCVGDDHVAEENFVEFYCEHFSDGGGLYTFHRSDLGPSTDNVTFRRNIVVNGVGSIAGIIDANQTNSIRAIYIDNGSKYTVIDKNTVIGSTTGTPTVKSGIFINGGTTDHWITDNVAFNFTRGCVTIAQGDFTDPDHPDTTTNVVLTGNILISASPTTYCVLLQEASIPTTFNPFGGTGSSDNNSYISVYNTSNNVNGYASTTDGSMTGQTLTQWRTRCGDDVNSNAISNTLTYSNIYVSVAAENIVDYNYSTSVESISIGANYIDHLGATITSANIPAFESIGYFSSVSRNYLLDNFTGTNGTSLVGRSPDVIGPVPNVLSGTHTLSSGSMASSVNGLVSYNLGTGINDYVLECFSFITNTSASIRLDVRLQDDSGSANNRIILDFTGGNIRLREFYASATATQTLTTAFTLTSNTSYNIRIYCSGATVKVYVGGVLYHTMTTSLTTGNRVGIFGETTRLTGLLFAHPDEYFTP